MKYCAINNAPDAEGVAFFNLVSDVIKQERRVDTKRGRNEEQQQKKKKATEIMKRRRRGEEHEQARSEFFFPYRRKNTPGEPVEEIGLYCFFFRHLSFFFYIILPSILDGLLVLFKRLRFSRRFVLFIRGIRNKQTKQEREAETGTLF